MNFHDDLTRDQVLKRDIPWETYMTAKLITRTGLQLLRRYDHRAKDIQAALIEEDGPAYLKTFLMIIRNVTKEETIEYALALIDELLSVNPKRARLFHHESFRGEDVYEPLLKLVMRRNWFILETTSRILTLAISNRPKLVGDSSEFVKGGKANGKVVESVELSPESTENLLGEFIGWLCEQLRYPLHPTKAVGTAVSSLSILLRETAVRDKFVKMDGVKLLEPIITPVSAQANMQMVYETVLCVWLLSFYDPAVAAMKNTRILQRVVEVVKSSSKEKVVRVSILTLKNLLGKGQGFGEALVEVGFPKVVQTLKLQAWTDDDLKDALDKLEEGLRLNIKVQSSFDVYKKEVLSGNLDWTPMHKDAAFWRENFARFEESDFQVLRVLVTLLENSRDPRTLAVACHDLGQFIAVHPSGRFVVLDMKAKERVMELMGHKDAEVQKQALLCCQKLLLSAKYASYLQ
eukprot:TRINITY_DN1338_c0_g1_i3.p1 TRINITY_DN1338_c0_g1~~TRINITY_DN1338_c0_g1_i3.p1  ORF type:complete len:478 (-),score=155.16 TRINITY_DN1338_c0_g1_i3:309-1694(-)